MPKVLLVVVSFWLVVLLFSMSGCSSGHSPFEPSPIETETSPDLSPGIRPATSAPGHHLLGAFSMQFDLGTKTLSVVPNREAMAHFNVTPFLLPPHCDDCFSLELLEFWPDQHRMKIKIYVKNPFQFKGYDVRAIFMHNQQGWDVDWNQGYTSLFDDGGEVTINPFVDLGEEFGPGHASSVDRWITFPDDPDFGSYNIIIDASWPEHCEDIYLLERNTSTIPVDYGGSNIHLELTAEDWQDDIISIAIDATEIGGGVVEFEYQGPDEHPDWTSDFFLQGTSGGVEPGEYRLLVTGLTNSPIATYTYFNFFLNPLPSPADVTPGNLEFGTHSIVVWDDYRLVSARKYYGIDIFDAHNLQKPQWAGSVQIQDDWENAVSLNDIAVLGDLAFITSGLKGVYIVDMSYIYQPELLGLIEFTYPLNAIAGDDYIYIGRADENSEDPGSIVIIDPEASPLPQIVGELATEKLAASLAVRNGYLYFTSGPKLFTASLADPVNPVVLDDIPLPGDNHCRDLAVQGDILCGYLSIGNDPHLFTCDISNPEHPELAAVQMLPSSCRNLTLKDGYAYVVTSQDGIQVADVDPPDEMHIVGQIDTLGSAWDITSGNEYIYATEHYPGGLTVYDPTPPEEPVCIERLERLEYPKKLILDGDHAYLADQSSFKVLDINPPERTRIVASLKTPGPNPIIWDMKSDGDLICILVGHVFSNYRLVLISVADPENPEVVMVVWGIGVCFSRNIVAGNGYAYVTNSDGLVLIDIDPPETAHIVGTTPNPFDNRLCDLKNDRLYLYSETSGLQVHDVTVPVNPILLGEMPPFGDIGKLIVRGNYAYVGGWNSIMVINISDPQTMEIIAEAQVPFGGGELFLMGGFLFATAWDNGVWVADIFPPGTIDPVFTIELPPFHQQATDVACQNGYMFITTKSFEADSLRIYKWW